MYQADEFVFYIMPGSVPYTPFNDKNKTHSFGYTFLGGSEQLPDDSLYPVPFYCGSTSFAYDNPELFARVRAFTIYESKERTFDSVPFTEHFSEFVSVAYPSFFSETEPFHRTGNR
jgi:hypothetical protein